MFAGPRGLEHERGAVLEADETGGQILDIEILA